MFPKDPTPEQLARITATFKAHSIAVCGWAELGDGPAKAWEAKAFAINEGKAAGPYPDAPLPPRFSEGVWKKIERANAAGATTLWTLLRIRITETFARPSLAVCYVALLLLIGLAAGYWQGRIGSQRAEERFRADYVAAVDPYLHRDR